MDILSLIVGVVIGTVLGYNWDSVKDWFEEKLSWRPSEESVQKAKDFIKSPLGTVLLVVVSILIIGGVCWAVLYQPADRTVAVGNTYELSDGCDVLQNITVTETHVQQGFIVVGKGECERIYNLRAPDPDSDNP